jgi:hypothetical protein
VKALDRIASQKTKSDEEDAPMKNYRDQASMKTPESGTDRIGRNLGMHNREHSSSALVLAAPRRPEPVNGQKENQE